MSDVALRFGAVDDGLTAQFRKVKGQLEDFKSNASGVASSIAGTFKAVAGIGAVLGLAKLAGEALEFADAQKKMSVQLGMSVESTQRLSYIAGQTSVDVGRLTDGVFKLERMLGGLEEGSDAAAKRLASLGLANEQFNRLNSEEKFNAVAKAISGLADENERAAAASDLFGKGAKELLPVLDAIGKEGTELAAKLDAIGGPVGKDAIDTVDKLGDELSTAGLAAKSLVTELLAMIAPPVIAGLQALQTTIAATRLALKGGQGDNEAVNLDNRIRALQDYLAHPTGSFTWQGYEKEIRSARRELERLLDQQAAMFGVGAFAAPKMQQVQVSIAAPDTVAFEETDEDRKKRLKEEEEARLQRLQHQATVNQIEEDMEFRHNLKLKEIDQKALDESIARTTDAVGRQLQIRTDAEEFLANVRRTFGLEEIKFEEIKDKSILEIASGMFGALARENSKLAKIQQGIALAQTIWSTATGIMKAFETLPWPANLAAAAKVALTGAIQVAKIKSTNYSAGSVSGTAASLSGGSSIGSARDTNERDTPDVTTATGSTTVYLSGFITRDIIDYMVEGLREGFDRDVVIIPENSRQAQIIRGNA